MTVKELWMATTADIYLARKGQEPLKLPSGGRLQILAREKVPIEAWQALALTLEGLEVPKKEET